MKDPAEDTRCECTQSQRPFTGANQQPMVPGRGFVEVVMRLGALLKVVDPVSASLGR